MLFCYSSFFHPGSYFSSILTWTSTPPQSPSRPLSDVVGGFFSGDEVSPGCLSRLAPLSSPLQFYAIRPHTQLRPVVGIWEIAET